MPIAVSNTAILSNYAILTALVAHQETGIIQEVPTQSDGHESNQLRVSLL